MVCAATGYPLPRVTLKKEHKSQTTEIRSSFQNISYSVENVKASDAGKYICIAHNIADTVTKEVLVTIKCKLFVFTFVCCVFFVDCLPLVLHFYGPSLSRSVPGDGATFLRLEFILKQKQS